MVQEMKAGLGNRGSVASVRRISTEDRLAPRSQSVSSQPSSLEAVVQRGSTFRSRALQARSTISSALSGVGASAAELLAAKLSVLWAANKSFEILKFKFKFPTARTFELFRARSRLYRSRLPYRYWLYQYTVTCVAGTGNTLPKSKTPQASSVAPPLEAVEFG